MATLYTVLVPSFAAVSYFDQPVLLGLIGELKMLGLTYFFSFLGLILWLRPTLGEIRTGVLFWGVATFAILVAVFVLVPDSAYARVWSDDSSRFIDYDPMRGYRIRMPMFFGDLAIFWAFRRFLKGRSPLMLVATVLFLALQVLLIKQRAFTVAIVMVLALVGAINASMMMKIAVAGMAALGAVAIFSIDFFAVLLNPSQAPGIDTREITMREAIDFLGTDPLRWFIGVGTLSPENEHTLMSYFRHFFYLADIGWVGNVFEFGLIGTVLLLSLSLRVMLFHSRHFGRLNDPFLGALSDQALYSLFVSWIHPELVLSPGEIGVIMAIQVYALRLMLRAEASPQPVLQAPSAPHPWPVSYASPRIAGEG